jgi:hypothetical protein
MAGRVLRDAWYLLGREMSPNQNPQPWLAGRGFFSLTLAPQHTNSRSYRFLPISRSKFIRRYFGALVRHKFGGFTRHHSGGQIIGNFRPHYLSPIFEDFPGRNKEPIFGYRLTSAKLYTNFVLLRL